MGRDNPATAINKTMDRADLETPAARKIVGELNGLITDFRARGLRISSWYGALDLPDDPASSERVNRGYRLTGNISLAPFIRREVFETIRETRFTHRGAARRWWPLI